MLVHAYQDAGVLRSIEAGVQSLDHATPMTEVSAKAIKEADVWVVPYFSMLSLDEETISGALGPLAVEKFLAVQNGARNQIKLLKEYGIRKVAFSTDIIGDPVALTKQNNELGYRLEVWSSYEVLLQATSTAAELMALSGKLNPYTEGTLGAVEVGAYADILNVDYNRLEDISVLGGNSDWFDAAPRQRGIETIRGIMKDGVIYKNTLN